MTPLPVRPLPIPTEPIVDYLERLANANGYKISEFLTWFGGPDGVNTKTLSDGLFGHVLPPFSGPTNQRVKIPTETFHLQASDFTYWHRRWCPACIDHGKWIRPVWRLKLVTACTTHRVRLLQICPRCNSYPDLQAILDGSCTCGLRFVQSTRPATQAEIHISRLLGESLKQAAKLNLGEVELHLNAPQLGRLICYTGQFIKGPSLRHPGKIRNLEDIEVASALAKGAAILLGSWPENFWHCLELFVRAAPNDASVRRVFGPLYHVLYKDLRDPVFNFLREAFELFLLEHWRGELCGRHRLFSKKTITDHRHQGITRIARAAGLGSERLRKMVHQNHFPANSFNPSSARHLITIDKNVVASLIPNSDDYLNLRTTATLFGFKRTRLRQLIAHGAILADAKPDYRISNRWHFRRSEIEAFLNEISQCSLTVLAGEDTVTLSHVLRYWRIAAKELSDLMRAIKLREINCKPHSSRRLCDLIFCKSALRTWLLRNRASTICWVTVTMASGLLRLKEQVVYELVSKNLLVADIIASKGHVIRRISLPSLQRFRETYISAAEIAKQQKTSVTAMLKVCAAKPVTGPKIDGGRQYFFKRADLDICAMAGSSNDSV